ncbi:hypothetical protein Pyn_08775 [Prunus yedoensis var. nudiflora]|uniref:Uncharacterized protein n=1 Tax=Prunus yedoensis var. nudiflora TaxID=2094558 RepID=A0A314ZGN9_PRUYE|nr:hypothetical protein Pyn_08775 [Prunus yedoensis var. nudiflora]
MVAEIAMKWTKVLRTGALEVRFMGVGSKHNHVQHGTRPRHDRASQIKENEIPLCLAGEIAP